MKDQSPKGVENSLRISLILNWMKKTLRDKLINLTKDQVEILLLLADCKGHSPGRLADHFEKHPESVLRTLKLLEDHDFVYEGNWRRTTNPKSTEPNKKEFPYYIKQHPAIFNDILRYLLRKEKKDQIIKFLGSEYTNDFIKKIGFLIVYDHCKDLFKQPDIRCIASKALLSQPSTIEQFKTVMKSLHSFLLDRDSQIQDSEIKHYIDEYHNY